MLVEEIAKITSYLDNLSFTDYEKLADKKNSKRIFLLVYFYKNRIEVEKDENKAFTQYKNLQN